MTYSTAAWGLTGFLFFAALGQGQTRTGLELRLEQDPQTKAIRVYRKAAKDPVLTQNANADNRPYLHPIVAPDGKGLLTEYGPAHHPHQTGIFWGFKYVNGRDFFMKWQAENYRRVAADIVHAKGRTVRWRTVYDLLDENGKTIMTETQNWTMADSGDRYVLDLEWRGEPKIDVTLGKIYVGGLFVRMPWHPGTRAEAVNSAGQRNGEAEQQRAIWTRSGRSGRGARRYGPHCHLRSSGEPWFSDPLKGFHMGFGPNNESSDWLIPQGKTEIIRYRLNRVYRRFAPCRHDARMEGIRQGVLT